MNRTEDVDLKLGPTVLSCKRLPHGVIFMSPVDLSLCSGIQGGEHSSHGTSITLRHWIGPLTFGDFCWCLPDRKWLLRGKMQTL